MLSRLAPLAVLAAFAAAAPARALTPDAQTTAIVAAADAFLATLTGAQRAQALFAFDDAAQRVNWTNFPQGGPGAARAGVAWGAMNAAQRQALTALLRTVLSAEGAQSVLEQVAADQVIANAKAAAPEADAGRPPVSFGSDHYFVSFLGTPSGSAPWMLQFGGHHLAVNATVVGPDVTLSPTLTGGEPLKFSLDGTAVYIVEEEATLAAALLASLTADQKAVAVRSDARVPLQTGPGQDGQTLAPEGLAGADMTPDQQAALRALIAARVGMLNADDAAAAMARVEADLGLTYFGWWGPQSPLGAGYFRVTGPALIMEFSPEDQDGDATDHAHNMYRDPTNEYGAGWIAPD